MSGFQAHIARLARAAETVAHEAEQKPHAVAVALNETAQSLPPHIIAATDPIKLNKQAPIFRCPAWAGLPSRPYHLYCERAGEPFPALGLHRFPYYLFGKNSVCDYVLEHPSISSVHAALIFNKEHECFVLLDLGSTNGTRLQGKRVESRRPVPIAVGSVIQFGYSSRTYELRSGVAAAVKRMREGEDKGKAEAETEATRRKMGMETDAQRAAAPPAAPSSSPAISLAEHAALAAPSAEGPVPTSASAVVPEAVGDAAPSSAHADQEEGEPAGVGRRGKETTPANTVAVPTPTAIHLYQLVIKHKDVDHPISRGRNKGEVITRSKADALEMARFIVRQHEAEVPVDAALGFSPWTAEEFVSAVREYCEVSSKKKAGDLGMVEKGIFSDVIDDAAFRLRRGEVSAPVETQLGIHILFRCD